MFNTSEKFKAYYTTHNNIKKAKKPIRQRPIKRLLHIEAAFIFLMFGGF
jgi:hypothetical protein